MRISGNIKITPKDMGPMNVPSTNISRVPSIANLQPETISCNLEATFSSKIIALSP
jgi:hypothetical protein